MRSKGIEDLWVAILVRQASRSIRRKRERERERERERKPSQSRKHPFFRSKHGPWLSCDVAAKLSRISDWRIASKIARRVNNRYVFASHETSRGMSAFRLQPRVPTATVTKIHEKQRRLKREQNREIRKSLFATAFWDENFVHEISYLSWRITFEIYRLTNILFYGQFIIVCLMEVILEKIERVNLSFSKYTT